jgi:hypothetical protein
MVMVAVRLQPHKKVVLVMVELVHQVRLVQNPVVTVSLAQAEVVAVLEITVSVVQVAMVDQVS